MNLDSQIAPQIKTMALTRFQSYEAHKDSGSAAFERRRVKPERSLSIHLTIHTLERVVRMLIPFYGPACSVAIYDEGEHESLIAQSTLGAIDGWTPPHQSLLLLIG
jgi:precorrin-4 methylase